MSRENYIRVETRLIASLQRAGYTNDLGLLYNLNFANYRITTLIILKLLLLGVNKNVCSFFSLLALR